MVDLTIKVRHQLSLDLVRERLRALVPDLRRALQAGDADVKVDVSFGENAGSFSRQGLDGDITLLPDAVVVSATFTSLAKSLLSEAKLASLTEQLDRGIRDRLRLALASPAAAPPPEAAPDSAPIPTPGPLPQAPPVDSSPPNSEPQPAPKGKPRKKAKKMAGEEYVNFSDAEADPIIGDAPQDGDPGFIGPPGSLAGPRESDPGFIGPPKDAAQGFIGPPDLRTPEERAAATNLPDLPDLEIDDTGDAKPADDITPDNAEVSVGEASGPQGKKYNPGANVGPVGGGKKAAAKDESESDVAGVLGKVLPQVVKTAGDLGVAALNRNQPQRAPIPAPGPLYTSDAQRQADLQRQQQLAEQQRQLAEQQRQLAELRRQQRAPENDYAAEAARLLTQAQQPRQAQQAAAPRSAPPPMVERSYASPAPPNASAPPGGGAGLVIASVLGVVVLGGIGVAAAYASKKRY